MGDCFFPFIGWFVEKKSIVGFVFVYFWVILVFSIFYFFVFLTDTRIGGTA